MSAVPRIYGRAEAVFNLPRPARQGSIGRYLFSHGQQDELSIIPTERPSAEEYFERVSRDSAGPLSVLL